MIRQHQWVIKNELPNIYTHVLSINCQDCPLIHCTASTTGVHVDCHPQRVGHGLRSEQINPTPTYPNIGALTGPQNPNHFSLLRPLPNYGVLLMQKVLVSKYSLAAPVAGRNPPRPRVNAGRNKMCFRDKFSDRWSISGAVSYNSMCRKHQRG